MENCFLTIGPPGTGKTTRLIQKAGEAASRWGGNQVLICSLTRTAAANVKERGVPIPMQQVGTFHSHCYRRLGSPEIAETHIDEWNAQNPNCPLTGTKGKSADLDNYGGEIPGDRSSDLTFSRYTMSRARMLPRERWKAGVLEFANRWESWKKANDYLDFEDLIERCREDYDSAPGNPSIVYVDEAQDCSASEVALAVKWSQNAKVVFTGDLDQCQPAGTMVCTPSGEVPIESLDSETHLVCPYDRHGSQIYKKGRRFQISSREYTGLMYEISADGRSTKATSNHIWHTKWIDPQFRGEANPYVVYLMRKGRSFRIGWCKLFSDGEYNYFHFGTRCRIEGADAGWILCVAEGKADASVLESVLAAKYGIPTSPFKGNNSKLILQEHLDKIFSSLDENEQYRRAATCLADHKREMQYPIFTSRSGAKNGVRRSMLTRTCNLIPGLMSVPVRNREGKPEWHPLSISSTAVSGVRVYSLSVEKYETYVSDGICTHNCIFSFRGATPRAFYDLKIPEKNRIVLGESHRLPERVHATAMEWISRSFGREQVSYRPRGFEGRVRYAGLYSKAPEGIIRDAEEYLARGKTVMIIGTCGYHVDPVINELRRRGIPFHNPYRESNGKWNPLGGRSGVSSSERILAFLRPQETGRWSIEDLAKWIEVVSADVLLRGAKRLVAERAKAEPPQDLTDDEIMGLFEDSDMALKAIQAAWAGDAEWLQKNLLASKSGPFNFPMEILRKNGKQALTEQPRVTVGTIHSVKGGEADVVYLLPDLSQKSCESWDGYPEDKAEVYRVFYVGMTRAREELILCDAIGNLRVRWN